MDPVSSNTLSNTCAETISSNCIVYAGPSLPGITICKGASVTEVFYQLANSSSPLATCYTGKWIDFSGSIALTGSGTGYTYTIYNFGFTGVSSSPGYNPMYKWTKDGDLSIRGALSVSLTVTNQKNYIFIPLIKIPTNCFPPGWTASMYGPVNAVDFNIVNTSTIIRASYLFLDYPTGNLSILLSFLDPFVINPVVLDIDFGGTILNIS